MNLKYKLNFQSYFFVNLNKLKNLFMKKYQFKIILIFTFLFSFSSLKLSAQDDKTLFHFACAINKTEKKFIISNPAKIIFNGDYDFKNDENLPPEVERQFLNYIDLHFNSEENLEFEFVSYKFSENEKEIKDEIIMRTKKYKSLGYKIVKVKTFRYD